MTYASHLADAMGAVLILERVRCVDCGFSWLAWAVDSPQLIPRCQSCNHGGVANSGFN